MHWCYLPSLDENQQASQYQLEGEEAHHALKVMRLRTGDQVEVFNGRGSVATARISATDSNKSLWIDIEHFLAPQKPLPQITLALAIPKGGNMELIVQKAVELGVSRIIPLISDRCIVRLKEKEARAKQEKWQRTALEACKQCKATHVPLIEPVQALASFLKQESAGSARICCALLPHAKPLRELLEAHRAAPTSDITILIGPEGDFSPQEYVDIESAAYQPASLGQLILRVETAVFMAIAAARYALDDATGAMSAR